MNIKDLTDSESRDKIVAKDSLDKNIFLSAGAGSGKTSSLVKRVMALVGSGVPISSVVAITFTREAAKMFYVRMTDELKSIIGKTQEPEEKLRYQRAFEEIDNAFFGTIDSFCRKLLLEHPAEAKITSQINPLDNSGDKRAIVDKGLKKLVGSKLPQNLYDQYMELGQLEFYGEELGQILLYVLEEDIFELELGQETEENKSPERLAYLEEVKGMGQLLKEEYETRIIKGNTFEQSVDLSTKTSLGIYEKALRFMDKEHPVNRLLFLENIVAAFSYQLRKSKAEKPDLLLERANDLIEDLHFNEIKSEYQELRYYKALTWARDMRASLLDASEEEGLISYNRSLKLLVEMLERDKAKGGALIAYLQDKYKYYFIDELQDTNQLQSQLFDLLAENLPGGLFIVGDEKQAIYRFRGGDIDNFKRIQDSMILNKDNDSVLQLTCNFRSSEPLRKWFNSKFSEDDYFGEDFPLIEAAEKQLLYENYKEEVIDGVYTFPVIQKKSATSRGAEVPTDEYLQVVKIINRILGKPVSHYEHSTNKMGTHNLEYSDILVLTYGKKLLQEYMAIFKEENIPYSVVGSSNLQSSKSLKMMSRVIDYLVDPSDSYKEGVCLLGEPFSISEKDMYVNIVGEEATSVHQVKEFLKTLSVELLDKSPSTMYKHIMDRMKLVHMTKVYGIEEALDTLYYGLELVRDAEIQGRIHDLKDLGEFINEDLLVGNYEYQLSLSGKSKGVRLMNLHKSKGLEARVVILGDPNKPRKKINGEKQYDYNNQSMKIFRIPKKSSGGIPIGDIITTDRFNAEKGVEEIKLEEESRRLRYVAATRAENILIIPTLYKNIGDGKEISPKPVAGEIVEGKWASLLTDDLKNILTQRMDFTQGEKPAKTDEAESNKALEKDKYNMGSSQLLDNEYKGIFSDEFKFPVLNTKESYTTINPSRVQMCGEDKEGNLKENQIDLDIPEDGELSHSDKEWEKALEKWQEEGSLMGNLVHNLLEGMVLRLPALLPQDEGKIIIDNLLKLHKITDEDKEFFAQGLWKVFNHMMDGGYPQDWADEDLRCPQDLLKELGGAEEIYTELPFSIYANKDEGLMKSLIESLDVEKDKDGYLNGIIDLLYKKDGEYIIVDYKTNFSSKDLQDHYQGQILLYKKVLTQTLLLDKEPKAYLYHIPARDESSLPKRKEKEFING